MKRKPRKRAHAGDGTVFESNGYWIASLSVGSRDARKQYRRKCHSEAAAWEALRRLRSERGALRLESAEVGTLSVSAYLDQWLGDQRPRIRPKTYVSYELVIRRHVKPYIGPVRIDHLRSAHVRELLATLEKAGVSARVRELVYIRLRSALAPLVGATIAANPVRPEHRPRVARRSLRTWTQEEARAFLEATKDDEYGPLYRLALSVGMRRGELLGLQWSDVDLKRRRLHVQHALADDGTLVEPKTAASRRAIELPARTADALAEQRQRLLARGLRVSPWVFPDAQGGPMNPRRATRAFEAAVAQAGVPRIRFHDLRHSAATLLLVAGVHPRVVQELLGHSNVSVTLNIYSHTSTTMHRQAAETLDAML